MHAKAHLIEKYDPAKSQISANNLAVFKNAPMGADLMCIPGVGAKCVQHLALAGITTSFQLLGEFLRFRGNNISSEDQCQMFFHWLRTKNIDHCTHCVVQAIAEKCDLLFPGLYDRTVYTASGAAAPVFGSQSTA